MATTKQRINISVSKEMNDSLVHLARRDQMPAATKAAQLLAIALDIEEDRLLEVIARERDTKDARWISHEVIWGQKNTQ